MEHQPGDTGVNNLSRARAFYEQLGWRGQEVEQTVFFQAGGMALVLWGVEKLAGDTGIGTSSSSAAGDSAQPA